jgi:hypothetical protein
VKKGYCSCNVEEKHSGGGDGDDDDDDDRIRGNKRQKTMERKL